MDNVLPLREREIVFGKLIKIGQAKPNGGVDIELESPSRRFDQEVDEDLRPELKKLQGEEVAITRIGYRDRVVANPSSS
ncbi:MAG: hypothetical protein A4E48_00072 [Methanosaeta sp. PtaU1.Bin060]|nr:MAG: hypothetical protein A4E48_00072 [Methanosaeta sp. PtaU1.Bin060]